MSVEWTKVDICMLCIGTSTYSNHPVSGSIS